jgi:hypothetical protein
MDRTQDHLEIDLIDLGAASVETKGIPFLHGEPEGGVPSGALLDE